MKLSWTVAMAKNLENLTTERQRSKVNWRSGRFGRSS